MGRPIYRPNAGISKPPTTNTTPSLSHLSSTLVQAARSLRQAHDASPSNQANSLNIAYRHAARAAHILQTLYGPHSGGVEHAAVTWDNDDDDDLSEENHTPTHGATATGTQPDVQAASSSAIRRTTSQETDDRTFGATGLRRRERLVELERLLRRAERLPRLSLPPRLRGGFADWMGGGIAGPRDRTLQFLDRRRSTETGTEREGGTDRLPAVGERRAPSRRVGTARRNGRLMGVRVLQLPPLPQPQLSLSRHFEDVGDGRRRDTDDATDGTEESED